MCVFIWRTREFLQTSAGQDTDWIRGVDEGQRARSLVPVSSVGEDRAILLGFTMMAFSVLMFFVVSMTVIKPLVTRYDDVFLPVSQNTLHMVLTLTPLVTLR